MTRYIVRKGARPFELPWGGTANPGTIIEGDELVASLGAQWRKTDWARANQGYLIAQSDDEPAPPPPPPPPPPSEPEPDAVDEPEEYDDEGPATF